MSVFEHQTAFMGQLVKMISVSPIVFLPDKRVSFQPRGLECYVSGAGYSLLVMFLELVTHY